MQSSDAARVWAAVDLLKDDAGNSLTRTTRSSGGVGRYNAAWGSLHGEQARHGQSSNITPSITTCMGAFSRRGVGAS